MAQHESEENGYGVLRPYQARAINWELASNLSVNHGDPNILSNYGPVHRELEKEIANFIGVASSRVVAFSSATLALSCSLNTTEEPFDEIVLPDFSFIGTLRAAQSVANASIVAADVDADFWTLKGEQPKSEKRTCYLPVDPFGVDPLRLIHEFNSETTVFDFAASLGTSQHIGNPDKSHVYCYSLHATKVYGAGEGGFAVFGCEHWAERARRASNFGIGSPSSYFGTNGKMSDIQAAFALSRFKEGEKELSDWLKLRDRVDELCDELGLETAPSLRGKVTPYWIVRTSSPEKTRSLENAMSRAGCETKSWWPISLAKALGQVPGAHSERIRGTNLGLPFFLDMTDYQFASVRRGLEEFVSESFGDEMSEGASIGH